MRFRVLGDVCAEQDGIPVLLGRRQERRLLGLLLIEVGRAVPTERLADLLWDGEPPASARSVIQTYVGRLRSVLSPFDVRIRTISGGYQIDVPAEDVDLHRFQAYLASARAAAEPAERALILAAAMELWHGPLLGDVATERLRSRLGAVFEELRLTALEQHAEAELACQHWDRAIALLADPARTHPVHERLVGLLMRAYANAGRKAEALAVYRETRQTLVRELGLEPGAHLRQQHARVLRGDDPGPGRPDDAAGTSRSPAFRPFQLPADTPDFVGRREATGMLVAALSGNPDGAYPAVASISGMPGTGKSALAVHAAHLLREHYPDGQIYLDLSGDDIGTVAVDDALGQVLVGLGFAPAALPATSDERSAVLRSLCADQRLLLVLDNARAGDHVLPLFPANPRCGVLVTSRMRLSGLSAWPHVEIPPLDTADALELLARIVGRQRTDAEPDASARVVELCAGLPLAIRIAGTRLAARSHRGPGWLAVRLEAEQTRLDELSTTGSALRSSFDISYRGLDGTLQRALRQLGLLDVPDFGTWLAAATLDCSLGEAEERIDGLVEARLLGPVAAGAVDVTRFRFHQLIRLYAREVAAQVEPQESRSAALARGYGACLSVAERLDQRLRRHTKLASSNWPRFATAELVDLTDRVDPTTFLVAERGTLVAAVHAGVRLGWPDLVWDLSLTLQRLLESHHHFHDWFEVATAGLQAARTCADPLAEAAVLCSLGELHAVQDQYAAATGEFRHALTIARGGGYRRVQVRALLGLSMTHAAGGRLDDSVKLAREVLGLVDDRVDSGTAAEAWMSLGAAQHLRRELSEADLSFRHALRGFTATGDRLNQAILLVNMGTTLGASERWVEAELAFNRSADICREIGFRNGEGFAYTALGSMLRRIGEAGRAEQTLNAALTIVRDYADRLTEGLILNNLGELLRSTDVDRSRRYFTEAIELLVNSELPAVLADAFIGLGDTELLAGEPDRARTAWARAREVVDPNDTSRVADLGRRLGESSTPRTQDR